MRLRFLVIMGAATLGACSYAQQTGPVSAGEAVAAAAGETVPEPLSAVANPANWPAAKSPTAISDANTEQRIDALIAKMTLEQKVGQLIQADISTITPDDLRRFPLGSILAGGNSGPYGNERATAADWDRLVREFRATSLLPAANGVAIPIIFGVDAVHGHNNIPNATIFPHNIGLGAANDPELIERIGAATAAEVAGSGIEWTFAPTLAVPQDFRWGRTYEGYSSDPELVARYSTAMVRGLQGDLVSGKPLNDGKVAATAKHFLADGGTKGGKDQGDAEAPEADVVRVHAAGYPPAINAGALTVMASFSSWNGVKHHGNASLLTDVLKKRMGFEGFVVGDWNGHGQVAGCSVTNCAQAINAGLDMFMAPDSWKDLYTNTVQQARDGTIPMSRIDDAVRRILRVKAKLGLLDDSMRQRSNYNAVGAPQHLALAREAAAKSLVLLKNNGAILPIKPGAKVLVTGPGADDIAMQSGGWTVSWQGTDVTPSDFTNGRTIWQGISDAVKAAGGSAHWSKDGSFASRPDVAIVVYGEHPYAEFQGDVSTLAYQPAQAKDLALLKRLKAQNIPVVSVFLSGRPLFTNREINASDAFVAAWLPGTQGDGVADVIVAQKSGKPKMDFTGRLPFAWPNDARAPVTAPLFDLGYGLTYAASVELAELSEDPGMDLTKAMNVDQYFAAGRAQDPWTLSISDTGGKRPVVGPSTTTPDAQLSVRSVDVGAQEDGKAFVWKGPGSITIEGPPADITQFDRNRYGLAVTWRIDAKPVDKTTLFFGDAPISIDTMLANVAIGSITSSAFPLHCFAMAAGSTANLGSAFRLDGHAGFAMTLQSVKLVEMPNGTQCPN